MFGRNRADFEAVVRAYSAELYRYGYWLSRDRFTAEDLVQETFARGWAAWPGLKDPRAMRKWLYTILRNEHARLYEKKRLDIAEEQDLDIIESPAGTAALEDFEVRQALHALPAGYREPLLLQVIGGFTCEEIAKIMDLTPGATMTRLSRARLALRKQTAAPRRAGSA